MILVDADACPVKDEVEKVGTRYELGMVVVSNGGIRPSQNRLVVTVVVDQGADEADKWIAERAGVGDVVITSDIPLAARVVEKGARVLKPNGELLSETNIGNALATRDLMTDLRASNPFATGGGKPFSKADRSRFLQALDREMRRAGSQAG